jgi:hypothetical protein
MNAVCTVGQTVDVRSVSLVQDHLGDMTILLATEIDTAIYIEETLIISSPAPHGISDTHT